MRNPFKKSLASILSSFNSVLKQLDDFESHLDKRIDRNTDAASKLEDSLQEKAKANIMRTSTQRSRLSGSERTSPR